MPPLIKEGALVADRWTLLREARGIADVPAQGAVIVPLPLWAAGRDALIARGDVGVLLAPADDPSALGRDVASLPVIAIDFPSFADGRGYSIARLLRERHGFRGELRAVGDVLRDQLLFMARSGFDAFELRADRDPDDALEAFGEFSESYQPAADQPLPLFRRRT